ncbi:hypothetical protein [Paenimyroides tangerinum]|nr:hypothetical protein [Paenimyroides tangerinum]
MPKSQTGNVRLGDLFFECGGFGTIVFLMSGKRLFFSFNELFLLI